jgi:glycosyltransferase involved in cell wall biosynthesis
MSGLEQVALQPDTPTDPARRPTVMMLAGMLGVGGAERHVLALARLLAARFEVVLVHVKPEAPLLDQVDVAALKRVECLGATRGFERHAARRLAGLIDECAVDVVLCANPYPLVYAQAARWWARRRYRVVEVYHTTVLQTLGARLRMLLFYQPLFWLTHQLVFVCHAQRRHWARRGVWAPRVAMIHNGVDVARFQPGPFVEAARQVRRRHGFADDDLVVGLCAVFRPEKAHGDLLKALAQLKARGVRWKALLIGDGPLRADIERAIAALGLEGDVAITGFRHDVRPEIAACDAMALVSVAIETFSVAALEAMAMGKPLVMSDTGGAREQVVDGENGFLFPPGDVAQLADCLSRAADPARLRRMGERSRQRVEREYSEQLMQQRYVDLIVGLLPAP